MHQSGHETEHLDSLITCKLLKLVDIILLIMSIFMTMSITIMLFCYVTAVCKIYSQKDQICFQL